MQAQSYNPSLFNAMKWRMIGPHRGGRTVGACGVPGQPNVFYMGVNNGGVWKTTDYGRTWKPIFDDQPTGSIGDVAVAPSNPNVLYAGSGEGIQRPDLSVGNGVYKSTDAGKTWVNTGLADALQIGGLAIVPKNENSVFVAALGHPYGPNKERGVYHTSDGGKHWAQVLYTDENTGAVQVCIDPSNSSIVYADMWGARQAPWENGSWEGAGCGLYKSMDGGSSWRKLENGLPGKQYGLGRIGFCIAASDSKRLYAVVNTKSSGGIYRSNDAGESWIKMSDDSRLWDRGDDFAEIKVDPQNPDVIYDAAVVVWKSTDGGKTWKDFKGAPGGDDYHRLWINPENSDVILLAGDQGAIISVNKGETWSSWYNQPTAQFYHVSADNAFPYNVYSGQQESGSVGIASRGNDGQITFHDWHPVGAEEYGYVVADPLDPNLIFGGKLTRYDKRTGQAIDISPDPAQEKHYRFLRTAPVVFSPVDNRTLFYAGNVVFKTHDKGNSWKVISPDLTRTRYEVPSSVGVYRTDSMKNMRRRGVIYTIAPSPKDSNTLWIGTDDGQIQVTRDGGMKWDNVTPPQVTDWCKVSLMDAGHTDVNTAYAAVNCIRLDDLHPHIYRTHDGGKTWKEIVNGLPNDPINVVKEDPLRKGLLFAGSEKCVYVSFDDGDHWQTLRLNMPATSIRDLVIKDNDLVVATHGRSFWILDDITALRQINQGVLKDEMLYKPSPSYRVRWNMNTDTPLPPEEPAGQNPPDGAIIDYYLKTSSNEEVMLDISDSTGKLIRHYSSKDKMYKIPEVNIPQYWIRPQQILSADSGSHRFLWDMRYAPVDEAPVYPIAAIYGQTAPDPTAPWVMPGTYTVTLYKSGSRDKGKISQSFVILTDPRVHSTRTALQQQHDLSYSVYQDEVQVVEVLKEMDTLLSQLEVVKAKANADMKKGLEIIQRKWMKMEGAPERQRSESFTSTHEVLKSVFNKLQASDECPTTQTAEAVKALHLEMLRVQKAWEQVKTDVKEVNAKLKVAGLPVLH
jgi:photosystem II stability/assembly factor-like uncharacterized protein